MNEGRIWLKFDASWYWVFISKFWFPQITEHLPKKRVNVDRREKRDKLFENKKSLRRRKTEFSYWTKHSYTYLEKKHQIKRGWERTGYACLIELSYLTFGFLFFWNIPPTKRVNIFIYVCTEEKRKNFLKISNIFQSVAFWMGLAGSAGRMRWCRHKKKWVKVEVINFSFITLNHIWRRHTILRTLTLKFRRYMGSLNVWIWGFVLKTKYWKKQKA